MDGVVKGTLSNLQKGSLVIAVALVVLAVIALVNRNTLGLGTLVSRPPSAPPTA